MYEFLEQRAILCDWFSASTDFQEWNYGEYVVLLGKPDADSWYFVDLECVYDGKVWLHINGSEADVISFLAQLQKVEFGIFPVMTIYSPQSVALPEAVAYQHSHSRLSC